jgi:hypothetical protein
VVRAFVSHLTADLVVYRGAVAFPQFIDTGCAGYSMPSLTALPRDMPGTCYPHLAV